MRSRKSTFGTAVGGAGTAGTGCSLNASPLRPRTVTWPWNFAASSTPRVFRFMSRTVKTAGGAAASAGLVLARVRRATRAPWAIGMGFLDRLFMSDIMTDIALLRNLRFTS